MKKCCSLSAVALAALIVGCGAPSSQVSPQEDGQIRNNLSRQLTADEIAKMGGGGGGQSSGGGTPGSAPAQMPAGQGPKQPVSPG